jgi:hypothetical protein
MYSTEGVLSLDEFNFHHGVYLIDGKSKAEDLIEGYNKIT